MRRLRMLACGLGMQLSLRRVFLTLRMVILAVLFGSSPMGLCCTFVMFGRLGVCLLHDASSCWPANAGGTEAARIVPAQRPNLVLIWRSKPNGRKFCSSVKSSLRPSTIKRSTPYCASGPTPHLIKCRQASGLRCELPKKRRRTEVSARPNWQHDAIGRHDILKHGLAFVFVGTD